MKHPFAELIGLEFSAQEPGRSVCRLEVKPELHNPQHVAHGAVLYALADTGMGGALYPMLEGEQFCATIEIKISYLRYVVDGYVECESKVINKGKTIAFMESTIKNETQTVATATGSFSIFQPSKR